MINQFKDMLLFGIGSATLAKEVAEDFVDEMIKSGQAQAQERAKLVEEFTDRARAMKSEFESTLKDRMRDLSHEMNLVTRDELRVFKTVFEVLRQRLRILKSPKKREKVKQLLSKSLLTLI